VTYQPNTDAEFGALSHEVKGPARTRFGCLGGYADLDPGRCVRYGYRYYGPHIEELLEEIAELKDEIENLRALLEGVR
jgi:hypothetical protein